MAKQQETDELELLRTMRDHLQRVDSDAQIRILQYLAKYFELGTAQEPPGFPHVRPASPNSNPPERRLSFTDRAVLPLKEFLLDKQPKTDIERVACLAYYLAHYRDNVHFKTIDISKLNTEAAQLKFSNPSYAVENATNSGLLTQAGQGKKQISHIGERFVDALPNREAARNVLNSLRKRRSRKRAQNKKTPRNTNK